MLHTDTLCGFFQIWGGKTGKHVWNSDVLVNLLDHLFLTMVSNEFKCGITCKLKCHKTSKLSCFALIYDFLCQAVPCTNCARSGRNKPMSSVFACAGVGEIVGAIENNCCVQSGALTRSQPGPVVSDGDPKALQIPRDFGGDLLAGAAWGSGSWDEKLKVTLRGDLCVFRMVSKFKIWQMHTEILVGWCSIWTLHPMYIWKKKNLQNDTRLLLKTLVVGFFPPFFLPLGLYWLV